MYKNGINMGQVKKQNRRSILRYMNSHADVSRKEIAEATGLTAAAVTQICNDFLKEGLIKECGTVNDVSGAGRRKVMLRINYEFAYIIGVNIESHDTVIVISDLGGNVISRANLETNNEVPPEEFVGEVASCIEEMLDENPEARKKVKIVFVDIRPDTMNIDENLIEAAITPKTKVIVPVHYAGVSCEMDKILEIAKKHNLKVVEDAAQGMMSTYKGKALGTIGDFGTISFHETKNYSMGEGGAILFNDNNYTEKAEIIREKGTNRSKYFRGQIDKYTWVDFGSSYLPSDINAAYLWAQLEMAQEIYDNRMKIWNFYNESLKELKDKGLIELPYIPEECVHNAHMFYIKTKDLEERTRLIAHLKSKEIQAVFHYIPLHDSPAGKKYGRFNGEDKYTTKESERLLRLPLYYKLKDEDSARVVEEIKNFYK